MPCVMVNPRVPVATKDVFTALGLRNGELLVGVTDVMLRDRHGREPVRRSATGSRRSPRSPTISKPPALRVEPVIGEVLSALGDASGVRLARMSGSGATCFAIFEDGAEAQRAAQDDPARAPAMVGACGDAELRKIFMVRRRVSGVSKR